MRTNLRQFLAGFTCLLGCVVFSSHAQADVVASVNFGDGSYVDGDLVGQNGWAQFGTNGNNPIQVLGGTVGWPGGQTVSNQDAILTLGSVLSAPDSGSLILHYDILMSVQSTGSNPSYFAALSTLNNTNTSGGNFANARLAARSEGSGFVFGARVTGQGGYPFGFGTQELNFDQVYALRAVIHMVAGAQNDFIDLYVGPDFDNLAFHSTAAYTSGSGTDPTYGGLVLSQFGSATVNESGVTIYSMSLTAIPEPASGSVLLILGLGAVLVRRRK